MDSLQNSILGLSGNAFLIASILSAFPKADSSIQDAVSDAMEPDDLPDVMYEQALLQTDLPRKEAYMDAT